MAFYLAAWMQAEIWRCCDRIPIRFSLAEDAVKFLWSSG